MITSSKELDIPAVSSQELINAIVGVLNEENFVQLAMTKALNRSREQTNDISKAISSAASAIKVEQDVLSDIKLGMTGISIGLVLLSAPFMLAAASGSSFLIGAMSNATNLAQSFAGVVQGGSQVAQGGVQIAYGESMTKNAKFKAVASCLEGQLESLTKGLKSSSDASTKLGESVGEILQSNARAQIIVNNLRG